MHITFDSIPVTSLLIGSDNPAYLSVHLSMSAKKLAGEYAQVFLHAILFQCQPNLAFGQ